jgi:hypothetical protein
VDPACQALAVGLDGEAMWRLAGFIRLREIDENDSEILAAALMEVGLEFFPCGSDEYMLPAAQERARDYLVGRISAQQIASELKHFDYYIFSWLWGEWDIKSHTGRSDEDIDALTLRAVQTLLSHPADVLGPPAFEPYERWPHLTRVGEKPDDPKR